MLVDKLAVTRSTTIALLFLLLAGCMTSVKKVEQHGPIDIKSGQNFPPIQIRRVGDQIYKLGEKAKTYSGLACAENIWSPEASRIVRSALDDGKFTEVFREELVKANYSVVGNPDAMFDDPSEWKAELLVAGAVRDLEVKLCWPRQYFGRNWEARGGAYIKVDWVVYSRLDRKAVYKLSTEGSYETETATSNADVRILVNAFSMAVRKLLADRGFHDLVAAEAGPAKR